jgi:SAM-dependent methyltransferase
VEVALALEVLEEHAGRDILEIGNVMSHYVPVDHLVVDKYERSAGVVNADVGDLVLDERFDLILAVSTLEHVGLDEPILDPQKPGRAIGRLKALLKPGGHLLVTHPVGYNPDLDQQLRAEEIGFTRLRALVRQETRNRWRQVPVEQVWQSGYDRLLYTAHGLLVAEYFAPC